ncbi:Crp/Fnr family transcriptional regulator [Leptolyngbya sp. PL-A3]|uniref:Crp/Fnr family transcriptional regulator n=1 Tax=Leptolyngbya sp. PL-A3 TaxID=2933911 RepID=UPI0032985B75
MSASQSLEKPKNQLLAALSEKDYQRLAPYLKEMELTIGQVLHVPYEPIEYVYFPHHSIVSIVTTMEDGSTVEVGIVGRDGMVGIPVILGGGASPHETFVQVPSGATQIRASRLKRQFDQGEALQQLLLLYVQAFYTQVSQTAACNAQHTVELRLARWLLLIQDRIQSDTLPLTQEFISKMLGVRRPGVTDAAKALQQLGMIEYSRGKIMIVNRKALEASACECYKTGRDEFDRLLGQGLPLRSDG